MNYPHQQAKYSNEFCYVLTFLEAECASDTPIKKGTAIKHNEIHFMHANTNKLLAMYKHI